MGKNNGFTVSAKDKKILRGLARKIADIAALPIQKERAELWYKLNRLERVKPMILLQNGTWHETKDEIKLETEGKFARDQEQSLRWEIYQHEKINDDSVYTDTITCPIAYQGTGWGIEIKATRPDHVFGAAQYHTVIDDNANPSMIQMPKITVDWEATEKKYQAMCEIYDGILKVAKRGVRGYWFAIIDDFFTWRGMDKAFTDMIDRPEWLHSWLDRMTEWYMSELDQCEKLNILSLNNNEVGIGPAGLGFTDELPGKDFDGTHVRTRDQWGHATTQIFSEVSPAMHEEFALKYESRFLSRFGLGSYGCCEPLDKKVDIIRKALPNLRKLSMSPWVDVARGAEVIGKDFVFSYKPNPAIIGMINWDIEVCRKQLEDALEKSQNCVVEVLMKDLHTCRNESWRMGAWVKMAKEVAEEYA